MHRLALSLSQSKIDSASSHVYTPNRPILYSRRTSNSGPEEDWMRERFLIGGKEGGDRYDSKGNIGRGVLFSGRPLQLTYSVF